MGRSRRILILICCLVAVTRLAAWSALQDDPRGLLENDSISYIAPARALVETGRYFKGPEDKTPETYRSPGYPLFLALNFSLFGQDVKWVPLSQIVLFLGTLWLTCLLGNKLFGERAAWTAAALLALDPPSFTYTFKILTEDLSTFLNLLFVLALTGYFQSEGRRGHPLAAGISLGIATLVRPTTYYLLPFLLIVFAVFHFRKKTGWKPAALRMSLIVISFAVLVGGWQVRNYAAAGTSRFMTLQGAILYYGKACIVLADKENRPVLETRERLQRQLFETHPETKNLNADELDRWFQGEALRIIAANPWVAVKTHFIQLFAFFFEPGTGTALFRTFNPDFQAPAFKWLALSGYLRDVMRANPVFFFFLFGGFLYLLVCYALMLYGFLNFPKIAMGGDLYYLHFVLALFVLYIANVSSLAGSYSRYRIVVMPLLCVYSAGGLSWLLTPKSRAAGESPGAAPRQR
ncbi:MAG: glycosyltransferase family 39 protein [Nitrospinae bacterium]|nr:glycosyltransferase family 39 protein [Nitrospinota bacterium]